MEKISIEHNNIYQKIDTDFISANMPLDVRVVPANGSDVFQWDDDIRIEGDNLIVKDTKLNFPIDYQGLRFNIYKKGDIAGRSRCRQYNLRPQLLIPRQVTVIGYIGLTAEAWELYQDIDDDVYFMCMALNGKSIDNYEWGDNVRFVDYNHSLEKRSLFYRTSDVILDNISGWPRPRLEAIACGTPVITQDQLQGGNISYKPVSNDLVVGNDVSYFVAEFVDNVLDLKVESPLISICINIYNREHLLPFAIESALLQSYDNIELILVDDESSDRSIEIAESYSKIDDRIRFKKLENNVGCPASWSESIKMAKGGLVTYTSSDNIQDYGQIWHLNRFWQKSPADIVYAKPRYYGGSNKIMYSSNVNRNLALSCAGLGPSFLIPKWLLDESDLMHTEDLYVEDTSLTADLCTMGAKVDLMEYEPLYYYKDSDPTSLTSKVMDQGGYPKLLERMAQNRINRRNECVRNLKAIYVKDKSSMTERSIQKMRSIGFNGKVYTGDLPEVTSENGMCGWGCEAVVLNGNGRIMRCPFKDVTRGSIEKDFFLNKSPRPCWKSDSCNRRSG